MVTTDGRDTDADRLSHLLDEFGGKSRTLLNQRDAVELRRIAFLISSIPMIVVAIAIFLFFYFHGIELDPQILSYLAIVSVLSVTTAFVMVTVSVSLSRSSRLISEEIRVSAIKLAKLIRAASQFHEHSSRGFIADLELELRLTEAESVLLRVEKMTGLPLVSSTSTAQQEREAGFRKPGEPQPR